MIILFLSVVFLVLQGFGVNVIQDWDSICLALILEFTLEICLGTIIAIWRIGRDD